MATKYTVSTLDADGVATPLDQTFAKKAAAIEFASVTRDAEKLAVQVTTDKGTVVFEQAAPKKINMSPRYTRVVELPEGVTLPVEGRVAYIRPRQNAAVIDIAGAEKEQRYGILNLKTGKLLKQRFRTTRDCGQRMNEGVGIPAKPVAGGEDVPAPAPETTPEAPVTEPAELVNA